MSVSRGKRKRRRAEESCGLVACAALSGNGVTFIVLEGDSKMHGEYEILVV